MLLPCAAARSIPPAYTQQRGFGLIETSLALFLLSVVVLGVTSMLVTILGSFQHQQRQSAIARQTWLASQRIRQSVWMAGYEISPSQTAVKVSGEPPTTSLELSYQIDRQSVYNLYDCSRSSTSGIRKNTWYVREAKYPLAKAELICSARTTDIANTLVIGLDASLARVNANQLGNVTSWLTSGTFVRAVNLEMLLQHPQAIDQTVTYEHQLDWEGIEEANNQPLVWTRLRLPLAADIAP